jgi:hypothetical protein
MPLCFSFAPSRPPVEGAYSTVCETQLLFVVRLRLRHEPVGQRADAADLDVHLGASVRDSIVGFRWL